MLSLSAKFREAIGPFNVQGTFKETFGGDFVLSNKYLFQTLDINTFDLEDGGILTIVETENLDFQWSKIEMSFVICLSIKIKKINHLFNVMML